MTIYRGGIHEFWLTAFAINRLVYYYQLKERTRDGVDCLVSRIRRGNWKAVYKNNQILVLDVGWGLIGFGQESTYFSLHIGYKSSLMVLLRLFL